MSAEIPPSLDLPVLWYLNNKANNYSIPLHAVITHHPQRQIHKVPTQTNWAKGTTIYNPLLDSLFAAHNLNSSIKSFVVSVDAVQLMTKMLLLPAAAVVLLVTIAFIAIVWSTYLLANGRRQLNFAIQEGMRSRDEPSALVFGSHAPLPIRSINEPPRVMYVAKPIFPRTLRSDQRVNHSASGYQVPNRARGYSARNEQPGVMRVEVYPVQESLRGYKGTSVRV